MNVRSTQVAAQSSGFATRRSINKAAKTAKTAAQVGIAAVQHKSRPGEMHPTVVQAVGSSSSCISHCTMFPLLSVATVACEMRKSLGLNDLSVCLPRQLRRSDQLYWPSTTGDMRPPVRCPS
jgi:hypothetical protein